MTFAAETCRKFLFFRSNTNSYKILLKKLLKNRKKPIKSYTVQAARTRIRPGPLGARGARAFSPAADGQAAKPARRRAPLGPKLARSPAAVPSRPSPTIKIGRPSALFAETKLGDAASPANPRLILPLCLLSPRNGGDGRWPWRPGGVGRAAPPRLARRRARSPVGERAAVELAMDGARLSSPACAKPQRPGAASRRLLCAEMSGERRRKRVPRTGGGSDTRTR